MRGINVPDSVRFSSKAQQLGTRTRGWVPELIDLGGTSRNVREVTPEPRKLTYESPVCLQTGEGPLKIEMP